jgi:hypothetical protein
LFRSDPARITSAYCAVRDEISAWARGIRHAAAFVDWPRTLFDPKRDPLFGDEFIPPHDLAGFADDRNETLVNLPVLHPARAG